MVSLVGRKLTTVCSVDFPINFCAGSFEIICNCRHAVRLTYFVAC